MIPITNLLTEQNNTKLVKTLVIRRKVTSIQENDIEQSHEQDPLESDSKDKGVEKKIKSIQKKSNKSVIIRRKIKK